MRLPNSSDTFTIYGYNLPFRDPAGKIPFC